MYNVVNVRIFKTQNFQEQKINILSAFAHKKYNLYFCKVDSQLVLYELKTLAPAN